MAAQISELFSQSELFVSVTVPLTALRMADPPALVWLLENMRPVSVSAPKFLIAPPFCGLSALVIMRPEIVTVTFCGIVKMLNRGVPGTSLRCTVTRFAPGPLITTSVVKSGNAVASEIVQTPNSHPGPLVGMLKTIVSEPAMAFASVMAWRKLPAPVLLVFVTTKLCASNAPMSTLWVTVVLILIPADIGATGAGVTGAGATDIMKTRSLLIESAARASVRTVTTKSERERIDIGRSIGFLMIIRSGRVEVGNQPKGRTCR